MREVSYSYIGPAYSLWIYFSIYGLRQNASCKTISQTVWPKLLFANNLGYKYHNELLNFLRLGMYPHESDIKENLGLLVFIIRWLLTLRTCLL